MPKCKLDIQKGIVEAAVKLVATPTIKDKGNSTLFIENSDYTKQQAYKVAVSVTSKINKAFGEDVAFREQKTDGQEIKLIPSEQLVEQYFRVYNDKWNVGHRAIYGINQFGDSDIAYKRDEMPLGILQANSDNNTAIANELAQTLSTNIGFDYASISPEEAVEVTKNASNPWKGEAAFFNGSTVYFVGKELTERTVLHEFSHPLLRAISKQNPDLFNHLYLKTSLNNPEGNVIAMTMHDLYSDLDTSSALYKEEFLVRALTRAAAKETSPGFLQAIKDILYQIKQMLRRVFGQNVDVSKLDVNTTLDELAVMLKGDHFTIDRTKITQEDINAYVRERLKEIEDLKTIDAKARALLSNRFLELARKQLGSLKTVTQYEDMLKAMEDSPGKNLLRDIIGNLTSYKKLTDEDISKLAENLDWANAQAQDLVSSMYRLSDISASMYKHMQEMNRAPESRDNLQRVSYYLDVINYWNDFISKADDQFRKDLPAESPLRALFSGIEKNLTSSKKEALEIQSKVTIDAFRTTLQYTADGIDTQYKEAIEKIKSRKTTSSLEKDLIDKLNKWYDPARLNVYINDKGVTIDPIKEWLRGERGDAKALSAHIEGAINSSDPIIGGFAKITKDAMTEVMVALQAKQNEVIRDIKPLFDKANINANNIQGLANDIVFLDKVGSIDDEGKFVEKEEYTYLNLFKNTDLYTKRMKFELDEAQKNYNNTKTDENYTKLAEINRAIAKHQNLYWNQENVSEYYSNDDIFDSPTGKEAYLDEQLGLAKIREFQNTITDEYTSEETAINLKEAIRNYQQLSSILDAYGNKKTGKDLEKALILKKHKEHKRQYHKWIEYPEAFQNALTKYEEKLIAINFPEGSEEFIKKRQEWIDSNTVTKIKDTFYIETQLRYDKLKALKDSLPIDKELSDNIDEALAIIKESLIGYRDEDNQPNATEMRPERIAAVKKAQLDLIKFQDQLAKVSGLSAEEMREVNEIFNNIKTDQPADRVRLKELMDKKTKLGLSVYKKQQIAILYAELNELQSKTASSYYVNTINKYLSTDELKEVPNLFLNTQSRSITSETADELLKPENLNAFLEKDSKFREWFENNHIKKNKFNPTTKETDQVWERVSVWNVIKPRDDKYYEHIEIKDENGKVKEIIKGAPSLRFFERKVDPVWKTKRIEGVTIDNKGRWLPKTLEDRKIKENQPVTVGNYTFTPDYHNTAYEELRRNKPDLFNLLEMMKKHHLDIQKGLEKKDILGLKIPRYPKTFLEEMQSKDRNIVKYIKGFFQYTRQQEEGIINYKALEIENQAELYGNEIADVPITGLYKLDPSEVSLDLMHGMFKYMASAERQKGLVKQASLGQALRAMLKDPAGGIKHMMEITKNGRINRVVKWISNTKEESVRYKAIDNLIKKTYEGEHNTGILKDNKVVNQITNLLFKGATNALFALNIPSALKNSFSAMFQNTIMAATGKDMDLASFASGTAWATKTSVEISSQLYSHDVKGFDTQLVNLFGAFPMRQEHTFADAMSRTLFKDVVNLSWGMAPRRWTEIHATLSMFGGMINYQKVPRMIDGKEHLISYKDAFEVVNGQIQLKSGIDKAWAAGGAKFMVFKNNYDAHLADWNGGFGEFNQPEAKRHLEQRMIMYMRGYFVNMFQNRWGVNRMSVEHSAMTEGFYITNLKTIKNIITTLAKDGQWYGKYSTPMEKSAAIKMTAELAQLAILYMISSMFFGWSPDDKDKYAKLRKKSGPLPLPGVKETDNPFDPFGWSSNHLLLLTQNVFNENAQWISPSGYIHNMLDFKSVALGPTLSLYAKILNDLFQMATGNDNAYYKKSIGAYEWQDKGSAKIVNHTGHVVGLTAGTVDPALAIQNLQAITSKN